MAEQMSGWLCQMLNFLYRQFQVPSCSEPCDVLQVQKEPREVQAERRAQQEEAERARRKQQQDKNESKAKMKVRTAAAEGVLKLGVFNGDMLPAASHRDPGGHCIICLNRD